MCVKYRHTLPTRSPSALLFRAVAAKAVIDHTARRRESDHHCRSVGAYANEYKAITVQGEGASAETKADFVDGLLTITLGTDAGTAASAEIGTGDHGTITITCKEVGDVNYSVIVSLQEGENLPMSATLFADGTMYIALGTDENGNRTNRIPQINCRPN